MPLARIKPGDVFVHTIRLSKDGRVIGYDRVCWYLAFARDTSDAPTMGVDWAGIPVRPERGLAAVSGNGKTCWVSNLPFKTADKLHFEETGKVVKVRDVPPGGVFILGDDLFVRGIAVTACWAPCFSMSGVGENLSIDQDQACQPVRMIAMFQIDEETTWWGWSEVGP